MGIIPDYMDEIYFDNSISKESSSAERIRIVFVNAERGKKLDEITAYLKHHPDLKEASIILLNEIDIGMARSGNLNIAEELGIRLGMNWIFGIEFKELSKGEEAERNTVTENSEALHGNAVLSKYPLDNLKLLRLPEKFNWFNDYQKREGSRIALFSTVKINGKEILLVTVHLEDRTDAKGRYKQMESVVAYIEEYYPDLPVLVAGDMNTLTFDGGNGETVSDLIKKDGDMGKSRRMNPEKWESLFELMEEKGFDCTSCNEAGKITCRENIKDLNHVLEMNLDWFFLKGLVAENPLTVSSVFDRSVLPGFSGLSNSDGIEMTDHNIITLFLNI